MLLLGCFLVLVLLRLFLTLFWFMRREKLATLPQQVGELAEQVARQQLIQEDILEELRHLRGELRRARKLDQFFTLTGTLLILLSLLKASSLWETTLHALQQDVLSLAMLSLGIAFLLARLLPARGRL